MLLFLAFIIITTLLSGFVIRLGSISLYLPDIALPILLVLSYFSKSTARRSVNRYIFTKTILSILFGIVGTVSLVLSLSGSLLTLSNLFDSVKLFYRVVLTYLFLVTTSYENLILEKKFVRSLYFVFYAIIIIYAVMDTTFIATKSRSFFELFYSNTFLSKDNYSKYDYYVLFRRAPGFLGNSNLTGQCIVYMYYLSTVLNKRVTNFTSVVVPFLALLPLGSRTALVSFLSLNVFLFLSSPRNISKKFFSLVALFSVFFAAFYIAERFGFVSFWLEQYLKSIFSQHELVDSSLQARIELFWLKNIKLFVQHPVFGVQLPEEVFLGDGELFMVLRMFGLVGFLLYISFFTSEHWFNRNRVYLVEHALLTLPFLLTSGLIFSVVPSTLYLYVILTYTSFCLKKRSDGRYGARDK